MKKDMIRASIYIEKSIWQGIREEAHERWIPVGKLITELYESSKVNKVHKADKPQVPEKIIEVEKVAKVELPSSTGGSFPERKPEEEVIPKLKNIDKKAKKVVEEIPSMQSDSDFFNPQPKGKK